MYSGAQQKQQQKLLVLLRLAMNRINLLTQKKQNQQAIDRKNIATELMQKGRWSTARIRCEQLITADYWIEAMEVLMTLVELLVARSGMLIENRECEPSLQEAVHTIIYAAQRSEVKELLQIREWFFQRFGREFAEAAMDNRLGLVNQRVIQRLSTQAPDPQLVTAYVQEIATAYGITVPEDQLQFNDPLKPNMLPVNQFVVGYATPNGLLLPMQGTDTVVVPTPPAAPQPQVVAMVDPRVQPTGPPSSVVPEAKKPLPSAPPVQSSPAAPPSQDAEDVPGFDDLAKRFEALKKRS